MSVLALGDASRMLRDALKDKSAAKHVWIYFIQIGDAGPVKIGVAKNPRDRLSTLQTAHFERLHLLGVCFAEPAFEKELHARFAEHRLGGEWFEPHPDILAEAATWAEAFHFDWRDFRGETEPWPFPLEDDE